jgi:hypothetical protein
VFCEKTYEAFQFKKLKPAPKIESNWSRNKLTLIKSQKFVIKKKSIKCNFKSHIYQITHYHDALRHAGMLPSYASTRKTKREYRTFFKTFQIRPVKTQRFRCSTKADARTKRLREKLALYL